MTKPVPILVCPFCHKLLTKVDGKPYCMYCSRPIDVEETKRRDDK